VPRATLQRLQPWLAAGAILIGLWRLWPSLDAGWISDDFVFQAMMDDAWAVPRHPLDLFNFADGTPEENRALRQHGYPWWTPDDFKIAMLRPLAAALIWFDRAAFGDALWLHHLHSLAWWALLATLVYHLYRGRFAAGVVALATLLFAIDASHRGPAMWLANRGGLISVALGCAGLLTHLRWRQEGRAAFAWLSSLCFAVALLCGEWVFPLFAYVFAYALLTDRGPLLRRALSLLPAAVPALGFLLVRGALGYGAHASGVYSDPIKQPRVFFGQLWERLSIFVADLTLDIPASWWAHGSPWRDWVLHEQWFSPAQWSQLPDWHQWHLGLGVLGLALFILFVALAGRGCTTDERRNLRFLLLGAALSLVPVAGSFPSRRLVLVAMIGVAPALAVVMRAAARALVRCAVGWRPLRFAAVWLGLCLLLEMHVLGALRVDYTSDVLWVRNAELWVKRAELDQGKLSRQIVVMISAVDFSTGVWFPSTWRADGRPAPEASYLLSLAPRAHMLRRVADDAFELDVLGGTFLASDEERHFREDARPVLPGQRFEVGEMRAEVVRMQGLKPRSVRFTFDRPLESSRYVFLSAQAGGIVQVPMPEVGEQLLIPRAASPSFPRLERRRYVLPMKPLPDFLTYDPVPDFIDYRPG
jgi:hypothetical protein